MSRFADVLDALDLALGLGAAVLPEDDLAAGIELARRARRGRGHLGGTLVLALAGGTGTGKSSLLNALAGAPIASVSRLRPHTDSPLAWVDGAAEPGLGEVLDRLGVDLRIAQEAFPGLCLIDLPDQDSVADGHRATVDRLLEEVDGVIWVTDPEKYRDAALHHGYLEPLASHYGAQFVFVLNQVDRLGADTAAVLADFEAALAEDGILAPPVFATAADPGRGGQVGVEALTDHLRERLDAKRVAVGKLLGDVRTAAAGMATAAGVRHGSGIDFEPRWAEARAVAARVLADGHVEDALCRLEDFVMAIAVEVGGRVGRTIRTEVTAPVIAAAAAAGREAASDGPLDDFARQVAIEEELEDAVGARLRATLWERAVLAAALAGVDVAVAQAEVRLPG